MDARRDGEDPARFLARALGGDVAARHALIISLVPVVQARVGRILYRSRPANRAAPRQELEDFAQEVFVALFENDARVLRAWDATRGMSLANFVGLVAEREAVSVLRSGKRSPFRETASELEELDAALEPQAGAELSMLSRDLLARLADRLRATLSPKGLDLFYRLYVDEDSVEDVAAATGMTHDALYAWRSRLAKHVRVLAAELLESERIPAGSMSGDGRSPRNTDKGVPR